MGDATTADIAPEVERYFAALSADVRTTLESVRTACRAAVPDADEVISYGIPTFKRGRALVAFAAFKNHCSFFPMSYAVIEAHRAELAGFQISKGTIRFPIGEPLPATLVKKMIRARVAEVEAASQA